jgi:hypothetical protein
VSLAVVSGTALHEPTWLSPLHLGFSGTLFIVLAVSLTYYGYKLAGAKGSLRYGYKPVASQLNTSSPRSFMALNFIISIVFAFRGVYCYGSAVSVC